MRVTRYGVLGLGLGLAGCGLPADMGSTTAGDGLSRTSSGDESGSDSGLATTAGESSTADTGVRLDLPAFPDLPEPLRCDALNEVEVVPCGEQALPDSFDPEPQWSWQGPNQDLNVVVSPLVANLTDDNGDGVINMCDTPDVVITSYRHEDFDIYGIALGHMYIVDGQTGQQHVRIEQPINAMVEPALGDIDNDGLPEIVTVIPAEGITIRGRVAVFEHDGTLKWTSAEEVRTDWHALMLADLDADGDVEIASRSVFDHEGELLWTADQELDIMIPTAADLDDDDDLELITGGRAYHHDGTPYFDVGERGVPQVADMDGDGLPEVVVTTAAGIAVVEHDGTLSNAQVWNTLVDRRPAAIHDVDGDGLPEIAVGDAQGYSVFEDNLIPKWTAAVFDLTGMAGGTAFDFLGDGQAEAMYADEVSLHVFGASGGRVFQAQRLSVTFVEIPVVADIDNDGSAEVLVGSNTGTSINSTGEPPEAAMVAIRDVDDRWIQARRIWNQHSYHVTNVHEDGTIPQVEPKHWKTLNTFRTQAQIERNGVCKPEA